MKLLYFTDSYPYGYGEQWKTNELKELVKVFESVEVVPFHYGNNRNPVDPIAKVIYHVPLFDESFNIPALKQLTYLMRKPKLRFYLLELVKNVGVNTARFRQWISSSYGISRLLDHPFIKKRLLYASEPTIAYFFWGRKTAEITPLIQSDWVKSAIRLHGHDLYHHRTNTGYIPYQKAQVIAADKVLCVSQNGINYLSGKYRNLNPPVLLNRLGTLPIPLANRSKDGTLRLITCSSLIPLKRVHLIPEALSHITETQILWTHIGDGPEMERIKATSSQLPSNIEVRFTGWVGSRSVTTYYSNKNVDLFLNVSQTEGVPVSIMEAMAAGIPCMATNVGGVSEIVNEQNGVLLNPDISARELAAQIINFMGLNTDDINNKRCAAVETFKKEYEATSNAKKLSQQLNKLWNDSHN